MPGDLDPDAYTSLVLGDRYVPPCWAYAEGGFANFRQVLSLPAELHTYLLVAT